MIDICTGKTGAIWFVLGVWNELTKISISVFLVMFIQAQTVAVLAVESIDEY